MLHRKETKLHIVIHGNEGTSEFVGPFDSSEDAITWAAGTLDPFGVGWFTAFVLDPGLVNATTMPLH